MDIGILMNVRRHPDEQRSLEQRYHDHIADVQHAEGLGFSHAWASEHHFASDQWSPSLFPLLSFVAARTSTIRLGTHLIVAPYHHPLRLAEDAAVLDILSGGRLELTVGAGSVGEEFDTFGVDKAERFGRLWETVDILLKSFTEDEFDHHGEHYTFTSVRMTTKPLQETLALWVGASGPTGVKRAARRGLHVAGAAPRGMVDLFDDELRAHGFDPKNHGSMSLAMVHVADSEDQAWAEAARGIHHWLGFYNELDWLVHDIIGGKLDLPAPHELRNWTSSPIRYYVGTPERVAETLVADLSAARHTGVALAFRHPFMDNRSVRHSMDLFAEHVLPTLQAWQHPVDEKLLDRT
jgi:alkanesulfonate monooxygenase SsuD/methylene tetrahydromethanopterin reductase-like flavin-dependent oxidoreductase (luciferase family)